jgi:hypothetical protein
MSSTSIRRYAWAAGNHGWELTPYSSNYKTNLLKMGLILIKSFWNGGQGISLVKVSVFIVEVKACH